MKQSSSDVLCLYDTLSRTVKPISASDHEFVSYYCCGPTVYGPAHIGNFRTFVAQDLARRVIEATGRKVRHVRNITDVDDKTIRESQALGQTLGDFTSGWTSKFHDDCSKLNLLEPIVEPGAVAHIPQQIEIIAGLLEKKLAYVADDGSVYFHVNSFATYGRLSGLDQREITSAQTSQIQSDEYQKEALADFALWKARKPEDGDNFWQSPWSEGRPGWHLECSAMCMAHLGQSIDLHSGGIDLIFPHHENEIAQSEGITGKPFAHHWFHIAHLMVDGGKMSKSLGNLYTLSDVETRGFDAASLRYLLISGHYRKPLNFTWESMLSALQSRKRIGHFVEGLCKAADVELGEFDQQVNAAPSSVSPEGLASFAPAWHALLDDLNTAEALGQVFTAIKQLGNPQGLASATAANELRGLISILQIFGISPELEVGHEIPAEVSALADKRWRAKQARDFKLADALRDEIKELGWVVRDAGSGYTLAKE